MHGGDQVAAVLESHGVRFLFTLCGGHISPILSGAKHLGIRVVDVRHEATAVFAADAVARLTGIPGVAAVTAGPGLTNTITAVKNAQLAQSPVVILGGAAATVLKGRGALQDIDQMALMRPHVKYATAARRVRDLMPMLDEAFDAAQQGVPGPVFVECPIDLLYDEALIRQWYSGGASRGKSLAERAQKIYLDYHLKRLFAGADASRPPAGVPVVAPQPEPRRVRQVVDRLKQSAQPLLVIGSQAVSNPGAAKRIAKSVTTLGLPVYLSGMARGLLGASHPLHMRHSRRLALREADLVILAGVPCDFRLDYGRHISRGTCLVAANRSRRDMRLNRRPDIGVNGDAGEFLIKLSEALTGPPAPWENWTAALRTRDNVREAEIDAECEAETSDGLVNPLALCRSVDKAMASDSVIVADGGDFVGTASYILHPRRPLSWLDPGVFGTLGVGAGFSLGAKLCRPDAEVWTIFGDGAFGYSVCEFDTFVRHGIPIIAVVGNDAGWTQIAREQVKVLEDDVGTVLARTPYHEVVEGFGASGLLIKKRAECPAVLEFAKQKAAAGSPVLINALLGKTGFREGSISM